MSVYVADESLFVVDVVPPRQYVGAKAYRKDFEEFLGLFPGPIKFEASDLSVTAAGTLGYSHRIVHEHVSWPVDPDTGKADMLSKPEARYAGAGLEA